jgi:hypothetical protein
VGGLKPPGPGKTHGGGGPPPPRKPPAGGALGVRTSGNPRRIGGGGAPPPPCPLPLLPAGKLLMTALLGEAAASPLAARCARDVLAGHDLNMTYDITLWHAHSLAASLEASPHVSPGLNTA